MDKKYHWEQLVGPRLWHIRAVRDLANLAFIGLIIYFASKIFGVLIPLFAAFILAYVCHPLIDWLQHKFNWSRSLSTTLLIAFFFLGFGGFILLLWPIVSEQFTKLTESLPRYLATLEDHLGFDLRADQETLEQFGDPAKILQEIGTRFGDMFQMMRNFLSTTTSVLISFVLIPIYFYFFSYRFDALLTEVDRYIPKRNKDRTHRILKRMDKATAGFFRGRLLISFIVAIIVAIGWWLIGVPYWFLLAVMVGVLNIAPYVSALVVPLAVLLHYVEGQSGSNGVSLLSAVLWPSTVYFAAQILENWLLTPWIESDKTQLSIPSILLSIFIGGAVAGFLGLLLAIPVAACIKIILEEIVLPHLRNWADQD